MNGLVSAKKDSNSEEHGTNVGRFLAKRGLLLMKESRDVAAVRCDYGNKLIVSTLILSTAKSTRGNTSYGIRFGHTDEEGIERESAFLDFDEIEELIGAFEFVDNLARQMLNEQRDYTEVTYSTKDNIKFGFYQSEGQQQAFIDVGGYGNSVFLDVDKLQSLKRTIQTATQHLVSKGAGAENIEL